MCIGTYSFYENKANILATRVERSAAFAHYHLGLRPKPPAGAGGDCFITSGLRPEPPASASGDCFITSGLRPEPPCKR